MNPLRELLKYVEEHEVEMKDDQYKNIKDKLVEINEQLDTKIIHCTCDLFICHIKNNNKIGIKFFDTDIFVSPDEFYELRNLEHNDVIENMPMCYEFSKTICALKVGLSNPRIILLEIRQK